MTRYAGMREPKGMGKPCGKWEGCYCEVPGTGTKGNRICVKQSELRVGDRVELFDYDAYGCAIVVKIDNDLVHLERVYQRMEGECPTPMIGIERWAIDKTPNRTITVFDRWA